jgi:hypothetical protein
VNAIFFYANDEIFKMIEKKLNYYIHHINQPPHTHTHTHTHIYIYIYKHWCDLFNPWSQEQTSQLVLKDDLVKKIHILIST